MRMASKLLEEGRGALLHRDRVVARKVLLSRGGARKATLAQFDETQLQQLPDETRQLRLDSRPSVGDKALTYIRRSS